jgi:DNA-directed RNA polymerase specialized sigma24 family protein
MTKRAPTLTQSGANAPPARLDPLDRLVSRVATGDRPAFRCLYAFLAVRIWDTAVRALADRRHALAVTRSTFLDVWHTAGTAGQYDARDWIEGIAAFRIHERRRLAGEPGRPSTTAADLLSRDKRTRRQLAAVLGTGRATIRVAPATFLRVDDLDHAVDALATGGIEPAGAARGYGPPPGADTHGAGVPYSSTNDRAHRVVDSTVSG